MKKVLAFDFGASSGRGILATYENGKLNYKEIHRFENVPIYENDTLCWDFQKLLAEVKKGIAKAESFDSIAFDTWGVDFGLIDKKGKLLRNPVHYRDTRTEKTIVKACRKMSKDELYEKTGNQIMPINTLFQMLETDFKNAKRMLFMPNLFAYMLTGVVSCELSIASTSQMLDLSEKNWNNYVLDTFEIPKKLLTKPVQSGTVIGEYKKAKVVAVAGHDTQCAVASLPTQDEVLFLSCGTWSLLGTELESPILTNESRKLNLSNEIGANGKINYLKNIIGLWLIQESRRAWKRKGEDYSYADLEKLALKSEAFKYFIDPDAPEFAIPGDIPVLVQNFCCKTGQGKPETVGEIMRCIYESLALKYRFASEQIKLITGKEFKALHVLGGGTKDKLLCQMTANSTNMKVVAGPIEATALGNIIIQLVALGELENLNEGRRLIERTETLKTYIPNENWDIAYKRYKEIVL